MRIDKWIKEFYGIDTDFGFNSENKGEELLKAVKHILTNKGK
jgi:hypothetical protein